MKRQSSSRAAPLGSPTPALDVLTPAGNSTHLRVSLVVVPEPQGGALAVVVASGEIDIATVGPLQTAALAAAAAQARTGEPVTLVLDWEQVVFLDCSALKLLCEVEAAGIQHAWTVRWIPPSAPGPAGFLRFAADRGWLPLHLGRQLRTGAWPRPLPPDPTGLMLR